MLRSYRFAPVVFAAGSLLVLSHARADTDPAPPGTRPVIRGSGTDVHIVYRAPRAAAPASAAHPAPDAAAPTTPDAAAEALQKKTAGATDQAVLAFLEAQREREQLPDVIDADLLRQFRKAGAGDAVIGFLSSNTAVEIGPTAGEGAAAWAPPVDTAAYDGAYPDLVSSGYPFYGSYGGYAGIGGWGGMGGSGRWGWNKGNGMHHGGFKDFLRRNDFRFGNGFGPRPHPHPLPVARGGAHVHAAVTGGRMR